MRLVIAVVERRAASAALERLRAAGYAATRLASTGGFLKRGNVTLFTGVEDAQVDGVLGVLCEDGGSGSGGRAEAAATGGGVAFVTRVTDFRHV